MRIESAGGNEVKVWPTDKDIEDLRRSALNPRDDLIIQLAAKVGLRSFEIPQVSPSGITQTDNGKYRIRVPEGKDTTGSGGKPRDAYLPAPVERDLRQYQHAENIPPRNSFIQLSQSGIRDVIHRISERAADRTGNPDFNHISPHDLRRRFAQRLLVDENMNPRVVMQVGGWNSFQAIEPYLNAPSPDVVDEAFSGVDL